MGQDAYGNFVGESEPAPAPYPPSSRCCSSGIGAPDDADGSNGQTYVDTATGDIYTKSNGTWSIVSGGGGGGDNNQSGSGSPVGVKTPDYVGQGYTDTDAPFHQWFATGLTSADWFQIL